MHTNIFDHTYVLVWYGNGVKCSVSYWVCWSTAIECISELSHSKKLLLVRLAHFSSLHIDFLCVKLEGSYICSMSVSQLGENSQCANEMYLASTT